MPQALRAAVGRTRVSHRFQFPVAQFPVCPESLAYQVLARKWRPQRFDDVIGQRGVTQTLRNAIAAKRIAQSFVFAGPRGVGKTTTARILARALNCEKGPTADPCGVCDACVEIAEGRDIDVFEIDAATHTQVDKVREIIIAGLGMAPVRNRYKIFIIDEVHRLSQAAFDALLKSIEEPPPHVVFMMATTEIEKVPATIQSRSQVFELKTIGVKPIADQLRRIADAEKIAIDDAALMLVARAGDGSMRDAQSALDQVIAFAGDTVTADDVTTVLGLVRRDLLFEMADAVAREDAAVVFDLAARAVESGYDLRLVIRELARLIARPPGPDDRSLARLRSRDRRRSRAPALLDLARRFSARRSDARVRRPDEGGGRYPRVDAAAVSPRDGAAAMDSPAQARAADRPHRSDGRGVGRRVRSRQPSSAAKDRRAAPTTRRRDGGRAAVVAERSQPQRRARRRRRRTARPSRDASPRNRPSRGRSTSDAGTEGSVPQRDPQVEEVLPRHRRGAGAADRRRAAIASCSSSRPQHRALRVAARAESRAGSSDRAASSPDARCRVVSAEGAAGPQRRRRRRRPSRRSAPRPIARSV